MTQLCGFELSEDDLRRVVKIMSTVPGVDTPQKALSWALQNVEITPSKDKKPGPPPPPPPRPPIKLIDLDPDTHSRIQVHPDFKMTLPDKTTWKLHDNMMLMDIEKLVSVADAGEDRNRVTMMLANLTKLEV